MNPVLHHGATNGPDVLLIRVGEDSSRDKIFPDHAVVTEVARETA